MKIGPATLPKFLTEPTIPITVPILSFFEYSDTSASAEGKTVASEIPIKIAGINIVEEFIVNETKNIDILRSNNPNIIFL